MTNEMNTGLEGLVEKLNSVDDKYILPVKGLEKAINELGKAYVMGAEQATDLSVTQDELNEMIAIFEGSNEIEETINTADTEFIGMEADDISNTDALYYLEEMIECGLADETEQNVYYDIKWFGRCKRGEMAWVKKNMIKMYNEKF